MLVIAILQAEQNDSDPATGSPISSSTIKAVPGGIGLQSGMSEGNSHVSSDAPDTKTNTDVGRQNGAYPISFSYYLFALAVLRAYFLSV